MLVVAVVPVLRGRARTPRCGRSRGASASAASSRSSCWSPPAPRWLPPRALERPEVLQAKLALLVLVGVLVALHVVTPYTRAVSLSVLAASLLIVWLGIRLTYG